MTISGTVRLEWSVDQAGYELVHVTPPHDPAHPSGGGEWTSLLGFREPYDVIRGKGGSPRLYRPLEEHPGLYRRFAEQCESVEGLIEFANEFGLPIYRFNNGYAVAEAKTEEVFRNRAFFMQIARALDNGDTDAAAHIFNHAPQAAMTCQLVKNSDGRFDSVIIPTSLAGAFLVQAMSEIRGESKFRRCKNCPTWFPYGSGTGHTSRREFCSDRCRVAWGRRHRSAP